MTNSHLLTDLLALTKTFTDLEKKEIKKQSSDKNIFYAIFILNKHIQQKIELYIDKQKFDESNSFTEYIVTTIANTYLQDFKKSISITLVHEFNILSEAQIIKDNFHLFIEKTTNDNEWIEYFFDKYPVILDLYYKNITYSLDFADEFLHHLNADSADLETTFGLKLDQLKSFEVFAGDNHNNLKSVAKLAFENNKTIFYKPRSLETEHQTYRFFEFLEKKGLKKSIYIPTILSGNHHGWMKGVDFKEVESETELKEFYKNQGINLCIFYFLGATDLIADNIITYGKWPCYFDLECILQPNFGSNENFDLYEINSVAANYLRMSVLRTNLLPQYGMITDNYQGISISGLSIIDHKLPSYTVKNVNGKFVREYDDVEFKQEVHLPSFNNIRHKSSEFMDEILEGFNTAYDFFIQENSKIRNYIVDHFSNLNTRVLYRSTYIYAKILEESFLPVYVSDPNKRTDLFNSLKNAELSKINNSSVIRSEIEQLQNLDIPIFYSSSSSKDIYSGSTYQSLLAENFYSLSGLDCTLRKFHDISVKDKIAQLDMIRSSFSIHEGYEIKENIFYGNKINFQSDKLSGHDKNLIVKEAENIYNKIQEKCFIKDDEISYLGLFQTQRYTWDFSSQRWGIFEGLDGMSFFYLNLFKITSDEKYIVLGLNFLQRGLKQFQEYYEFYHNSEGANKISLLSYPVSTFYIAEYYMQEGIDVKYLSSKNINLLLDWIKDFFKDDNEFDFMGGGAGTIIYLLKLYDRLQKPDILHLAGQIADYIIAHSIEEDDFILWKSKLDKAYSGFSHGASGIAYPLIKLSSYTDNKAYGAAAIKALKYEQTLFDGKNKLWYSFKNVLHNTIDHSENHFWAYGSGSIAASRLVMREYINNMDLDDEIIIAVENLKQNTNMINFNYSSGVFGNLDVINTYASIFNDINLQERIVSFAIEVIKRKKADQVWSCAPIGIHTISSIEMAGFFTGLAGIGNTLLNIAYYNKTLKLFT